jgi:hypothetical protein
MLAIQTTGLSDAGGPVFGFGNLGALTEDDKSQLAQQVKDASTNFMSGDVRSILATIPTDADRSDVAAKAIALGGDPTTIHSALASVQGDAQSSAAFQKAFTVSTPVRILWGVLSTASFAASVYHGYKRNNSVGWAIWWGLMGGLFPVITPVIAFAQGFAQPKRSGFGRRRKARVAGFGQARRYRRRNVI